MCVFICQSLSRFTGPEMFGIDLDSDPSGDECLTFVLSVYLISFPH